MSGIRPDDPRIQQLKEIRARKPDFTSHQACMSLGVATTTLKKWADNGWIEPFPKLSCNANSPWKKWVPHGK